MTRCGADKGLQGPCVAVLSFVPQPRGSKEKADAQGVFGAGYEERVSFQMRREREIEYTHTVYIQSVS